MMLDYNLRTHSPKSGFIGSQYLFCLWLHVRYLFSPVNLLVTQQCLPAVCFGLVPVLFWFWFVHVSGISRFPLCAWVILQAVFCLSSLAPFRLPDILLTLLLALSLCSPSASFVPVPVFPCICVYELHWTSFCVLSESVAWLTLIQPASFPCVSSHACNQSCAYCVTVTQWLFILSQAALHTMPCVYTAWCARQLVIVWSIVVWQYKAAECCERSGS